MFGVEYLRPLPTADLNGTIGMSLGTLLLVFYYSVKIKGFGGWLHELTCSPFGMVKLSFNPLTWIGALLLGIGNIGMNIVEYCGRVLSHGMRLYGNMYAGELIFFLIAGLGGTVTAYRHRDAPDHRHGLGDLPHPDRAAAGVHFHDADAGLHRPGARAPLIAP